MQRDSQHYRFTRQKQIKNTTRTDTPGQTTGKFIDSLQVYGRLVDRFFEVETVSGKCRSCRKIDNDARTRQDYSHYVYMLRQLRLSEEKMADGSRIALLLQVRSFLLLYSLCVLMKETTKFFHTSCMH